MAEPTKIDFNHRRIREISDFTEIVEMLFPGNRNQQHAAARILRELKWADGLVPNLAHLERKHGISRRTLQRARAKLSRLGLIERVSRFSNRHGGQQGWKLSGRFSAALRLLAENVEAWPTDRRVGLEKKEVVLAALLHGRLCPAPNGRSR